MKTSSFYVQTLKDPPKDAEVMSHQLMVRAGLIRKLASGIYTLLPLGLKVMRKFEAIVREEMNAIGAQECEMPSILPSELWRKSGRWDLYGKELLRVTDRAGREFCYGPTHEEVVTELVNEFTHSYKQLPVTLYQIQSKFRDEIRPRFGLMRAREFAMKDAYSFHESEDCLNALYLKMSGAYEKIFARCGLKFQSVEADSGSIGGSESREFMVLASAGEDEVLVCSETGLASNVEAAKTLASQNPPKPSAERIPATFSELHTPDMKTIEALEKGVGVSPDKVLKTIAYKSEIEESVTYIAAVISGENDLNELKLKSYLGVDHLSFATEDEVRDHFGSEPGYLGPLGLSEKLRLILDHGLEMSSTYMVGANKKDYHIDQVSIADFPQHFEVADLRKAKPGDLSPHSEKGTYASMRGIEVGHVFKLGDKYSEAMSASFLNAQGKPSSFLMGCYGIGIGRTVAAAIEQSHDDKGIVWPKALSPFDCHMVVINAKDKELLSKAYNMYEDLHSNGIDCYLDDRNESPGFKFKDADLLGVPIQVILGKRFLSEGIIEIKERGTGNVKDVTSAELVSHLRIICHGC